jgi:hypothetical protein
MDDESKSQGMRKSENLQDDWHRVRESARASERERTKGKDGGTGEKPVVVVVVMGCWCLGLGGS